MEITKRRSIVFSLGWIFVGLLLAMLLWGFSQRGVYSSKLGINVIVIGDEGVALMLIRPEEGLMTWVKLPDNLSIKISGTGAVYPLSSLWKFSQSERNTYKLVTDSISNTVGVFLPRIVKVKGETTPENLLGNMHRIALQTDLSIRDRILLRRDLVTSVSSKKFLEIDIPKTALTKNIEPDGKEFLEVNYIVNLWTKNKFVFDRLLGESSNVKIYNLSSVNGAGLLLSRQLESSGVRVVEVSSSYPEKIAGKGCVYKLSGDHYYTDYLLKNYSNCKDITKKEEKVVGDGVEVWLL